MKDLRDKISTDLLQEYKRFVNNHGFSAKGLGWNNDYSCNLRYNRMLKVIDELYTVECPSFLDVGCGFGNLNDYAIKNDIKIDYHGIDLNDQAIELAQKNFSSDKFVCADFLNHSFDRQFDYIVCNGILTFKNNSTQFEMEHYAKTIIRKMFSLCNIGIAFNTLTTQVDDFSNRNFYQSPIELMAFCMQNITNNIKVDHSYRFADYTIYLYKNCENFLNLNI